MSDKILVLVGPSAAGKTTIQEALVNAGGFTRVTTCTTRKKRPSEIQGVDYFFISDEEFQAKKAARSFLEYDKIGEFSYGITFEEVLKKNSSLPTPVLVLSPAGIPQIRNSFPDKDVVVVYVWAKEATLNERLSAEKYNGVREYKRKRILEELNWESRVDYDLKVENEDINKSVSLILTFMLSSDI